MKKPELYVVGLGPGHRDLLSPEASACLHRAEVIAGYSAYVQLLDPALFQGREIISTGMTREVERCEKALEAALAGKITAVVCSGDPGVYALAGLVLEMIEARGLCAPDLGLTIVPGIPAVCAAAALAGAPLTHDFACISLSDLLTPPQIIENRLAHALEGDFVVVLYNPRSARRKEPFDRALALARSRRAPSTPVTVARLVRRDGQSVRLTTLADLNPEDIDMFSLLIVGNSLSRIVAGKDGSPDHALGARMLTPRGYGSKYRL